MGQIDGVSLQGGSPVLRMEIDPKYSSRIYSNATVLLRPKTGLNDMVAELDPGSSGTGARLRDGAILGAGQTLPTVSLDEVPSNRSRCSRSSIQTRATSSSCWCQMRARRSRVTAGASSATSSGAWTRCRATSTRRAGWSPSAASNCGG